MQKTSFPKDKINVLMLEGVHPAAIECFQQAGYTVDNQPDALSEDELLDRVGGLHILGIRSKTQLTARILERAENLIAVGCYCIGTNQVDLEAATRQGIAVFNAPYSNTRSVAELTMANIVMLSRKAVQRSMELHGGIWNKSASGCYEVRHKTVGIIGYGHIGPQIGLLAESFGMNVVFYDILKKLPLGNARQLNAMEELLRISDFVTLHVPETPRTHNLIGRKELDLMKQGSFLLNLSRGSVVDVAALRESLQSEHLAGAAADVYPLEPKSNREPFESELRGLENVILTPHIGGSTQEAQENIGIEVASALIKYSDTGASGGAVNFPEIELPVLHNAHRLLNIHRNEPGALQKINTVVSATGANIESQYLGTRDSIGYLIMDIDQSVSRKVKVEINALDVAVKTRLLF